MSLVILRVVDYFFLGMRIAALHSQWAHVHMTVFGALKGLDAGTHRWLVIVSERVASQPASIDVDMSERAERVVVIVSFGAPRSSKLG
jgi:hypothetical protein